MNQTHQFFIGYNKLAELIIPGQPAMLMLYYRDFPAMFEEKRHHYFEVQQIDPSGPPIVRYWQHHFATETLYNRENLDQERHDKIVKYRGQAEKLLREYLTTRQVARVDEGLIAMPKDYTYLHGELDVLELKEDNFVLATTEP